MKDFVGMYLVLISGFQRSGIICYLWSLASPCQQGLLTRIIQDSEKQYKSVY